MKILVLDAETTGVDPDKDLPVQISMILVENSARRVIMNTLCNPGKAIPKGATDIHHITDDMVVNKPDSALACWLAEHTASLVGAELLVTYNGILFDLPLISRLSGGSYLTSLPHVDVLDLAYRYLPMLENHKLGTIYKHVVGRDAIGTHDAITDVMYTYDILEGLRIKLKKSIEDIIEDLKKPCRYQIMPISKHKGKLLGDVPTGFAKWLLDQNIGKPMRADLRYSMESILNGTA